jgi:TFIIF, beta subunit HTH domain
MEKEVVMDALFKAFESHQYYNVKDLVRITNQPIVSNLDLLLTMSCMLLKVSLYVDRKFLAQFSDQVRLPLLVYTATCHVLTEFYVLSPSQWLAFSTEWNRAIITVMCYADLLDVL